MKKGVIVIIALVIIIVLLAFFLLKKSEPSQSSSQENNNQETIKPNQNYLTIKGIYGKIIGKISPTEGKKIKGIVEISLEKIPEKAEVMSFAILYAGQKPEETGPNLGIDSNGDDGWGISLDTNNYVNGLYEIVVIANSAESNEPIDASKIQVIIEN